jgi:hypothetical protein
MNKFWQRVIAEPALASGAVVASINVIAAFEIWTPRPDQLAAINGLLVAISAIIVRTFVDHRHGVPLQGRRRRQPAPAPVPVPVAVPGETVRESV